jgi:carbonic anhydrase
VVGWNLFGIYSNWQVWNRDMALGQKWAKTLLVASLATLLGGVVYWRALDSESPNTAPVPTSSTAALAELRSGNARFVNSSRVLSIDTTHDAEYRRQTVKAQHPFAAILGCSDSRVCPEFVFDQRSGCLFEIRNAGNVVDEDALASFEYAVEHLHVSLILILAHKGCGAIEAVYHAGDKPLPDHLIELQKHMAGIHQQVMASHGRFAPELLNHLSKENARQQALSLARDSRVLRTAMEAGQTQLVCGLYDMGTGSVEFFDPE